jgi:glycosyltransferase involved in cell wall biosynthesis
MGTLSRATIGIVVIGRNEGANLRLCLESLVSFGVHAVYVDSGSSDGSPDLARGFCDEVLSLDPLIPFSAARARNEGFAALMKLAPEIEYVQFLDGDCTLLQGWLEAATEAFSRREMLAAVIGHLFERHPERSVYNRLCDLEWRSAPGDIANHGSLGGIMMVRADTFKELGGFNVLVIAGEDSEFGVRVGLSGRVVAKLDVPMATHDANILRFAQWWKRSIRAGHAIGQRSYLNGETSARDCMHEKRSTLAWGVALPILAIASAGFVFWLPLPLLAAYALLYRKIYAFRVRMGDSSSEARTYGVFTTLAKIANGLGLLKFYWRRRIGEYRIIEYK